ncbi:MAG: hypothetical protein ACLVLA_01330 [Acidaminococcus intestini]
MSVQTKVSVICIDGAFLLLVDGEEKGEMHNEPQKLTAGTLAVFAAAAL